jgi:hypothetical protein
MAAPDGLKPNMSTAIRAECLPCAITVCIASPRGRPRFGDKLVATDFVKTITRGFAAVSEPGVAVCLLPGTELAFDKNVQYERAFSPFGRACVDHKVARFRQVNMNDPHVHHDALEFPDGQIVKVTRLVAGKHATVLQLPASTRDHGGAKENAQVSSAGRIEA